MKDIDLALREGYIFALEAALNGTPVYDEEAPINAPKTYILITDINTSQIGVKTVYHNRVSITLDLVTKFPQPNIGSFKEVDILAGNVKTVIMDGITLNSQFRISVTRLDNSNRLRDDTRTEKVYRRILTFVHNILETNN